MNVIAQHGFAFLYALAFLTRIPVPDLSRAVQWDKQQGNGKIAQISVYYYPLVGALLGAILLVALISFEYSTAPGALLLSSEQSALIAVLLLVIWCLVTGGLHLDGLADAGDAWVGGYGDKQRTLAIMKDPYAGPMGIMLVVLVLLLKFAALWLVVKNQSWWLLLAAPVIARYLMLPLFKFTPYVREKGWGSDICKNISGGALAVISILMAVLSVLAFQHQSLLVLGVVAAVFVLARNMMMQRLGGTTGDTAGALIEVSEALILVVAVLSH